MNILNGKNTVLDFLKDAINKKEYARAYYILTLILLLPLRTLPALK